MSYYFLYSFAVFYFCKELPVGNELKNDIVKKFSESCADEGDCRYGKRSVEFAEIEKNGLMGNDGYQELRRKVIKKHYPQIFAVTNRFVGEPENQ